MAEVTTQANLAHRVDVLEGKVDKHDRFIDGVEADGKDGAKTRITVLENGYSEIIKRLDKINGLMTSLLVSVGIGVAVWVLTKLLPEIVMLTGAK